ncbi:unnamed protein product [Linum tenue]|uniref:Uncharacterized protein n=1 Tax=Linum tenue TaxID=586396 RepID=A0AAV0M261_9ROSI|nr:unnamed protein product [Linum tenue]
MASIYILYYILTLFEKDVATLHSKMETYSKTSVVLAVAAVAVTAWLWRVVNWLWIKPKRLEGHLRSQGFDGRPYRFLKGDLKEALEMLKEAQARELDVADDAALRVFPFPYYTVKNYGKKSFTWFGPVPRVHIMNPDHIKEVLTKIDEYPKLKGNPLTRLLVTGLASYNGDKWAQHRKILNPAFHQEKLKLMLPVFYRSSREMVDEWEREVMKSKGNETCELDVWPYLQSMTCDVISRTSFGSSYKEGAKTFQLLREMATLIMQIVRQVYIPGWRFLPTKTNTRMKRAYKEIQEAIQGIINKREKAMNDLLGLMMESNNNNNHHNGKNGMMTLEDVIEECKLFYFAGQETTSTLLVWTMVLLSKYPAWQERARHEVLHVLGTDNEVNATTLDSSALGQLKTMTMIMHEVMRLYPPVMQMTRAVERDTKMGDFVLPAGTQLALPTILVHKDPEIWGDDVAEFRPERFAESHNQQGAYFPFGWGPRICIGQNFALMEAKIALAIILKRFSFELSPSYVHAPSPEAPILQPQFGARLILHKL